MLKSKCHVPLWCLRYPPNSLWYSIQLLQIFYYFHWVVLFYFWINATVFICYRQNKYWFNRFNWISQRTNILNNLQTNNSSVYIQHSLLICVLRLQCMEYFDNHQNAQCFQINSKIKANKWQLTNYSYFFKIVCILYIMLCQNRINSTKT